MLLEEMKKIWRPGIVAILILMGFIFYHLYLSFNIDYFPNGPQYEGEFEVTKGWIEKYGTSLQDEEAEEIKKTLPKLNKEADEYVKSYDLCQKYDLKNYEEYKQFYADYVLGQSGDIKEDEQVFYQDAMIIDNYLVSQATDNIAGRIYGTSMGMDFFSVKQQYRVDTETRAYDEGYTKKEYDHAAATFYGKDEAWRNILPTQVIEATSSYFGYLMIWVLLSVCLLVSPVLVRDKMSGMRSLQWSSKEGRRILNVQRRAALLSTVLLTTLNYLIFGMLFATNGTQAFFNSRMYSFLFTTFSWPNWTYRTWCIVILIMGYMLSISMGLAAFFLSQYSGNYIAMLLKLIPLFIIAVILAPKLMEYLFYYNNWIYHRLKVPYIEGYVAIGLLIAGCILSMIACIRQRSRELFNG